MFKRVIALSGAAVGAAALVGCAGPGDSAAPVRGNAIPAPSAPEADARPDGEVIPAPQGIGEITGLESLGTTVALAGTEGIAFGTAENFQSGKLRVEPTPAQCSGLTAGADGATFVLACGEKVYLYPVDATDEPEEVAVGGLAAQQAVVTDSGELFYANDTEPTVMMRTADGRETAIDVEEPADQLIAVPVDDGRDGVVRAWREDTTIQDLDWTNDPPREGGRLRLGLGVGTVSPGPDGLVLAADATGNQIEVYTANDVIRLHQTQVTDGSPWAVAWDNANDLAWASLTDTHKLQAFDISGGVPEPVVTKTSLPDAQWMTVLDDATVVTASASGAGMQFIAPQQKN